MTAKQTVNRLEVELGANLRSANLRSADLSHADLSHVDLSHADLYCANLRSANLSKTNLSHADLCCANLRSADLFHADLSHADLRSANLSHADLRSANLSKTNLSSANLSKADLRYADLSHADLPSPTMILLANWGRLSDDLCLEAMRFDCENCPDGINLFNKWKSTGACPYFKVPFRRSVNFEESISVWSYGPSKSALWLAEKLLTTYCKGYVS